MTGITYPSVEPSARVVFLRLAGKTFSSWEEFGRAFEHEASEVGPTLPPYYNARDALTLADERGWFKVSEVDNSVVVADAETLAFRKSVVVCETATEREAIRFVQSELMRRVEVGLLEETAEALGVDNYGVETLAHRSIHLDEAYRIAAALGMSSEFAQRLVVQPSSST